MARDYDSNSRHPGTEAGSEHNGIMYGSATRKTADKALAIVSDKGPTAQTDCLETATDELARLDAALARPGGGNDPFASVVWSNKMPIVVTNPREADNPIIFANDAFCSLTGYARDEIIGRNCRFLQGSDTDPVSVALMRGAVQAEQPLDIEILNYRKDRQPLWIRLHMLPLHDATGALTYFFSSQLDLTQERERFAWLESQNAALMAEKAARQHADIANAEKSRFLAMASHDIRQPLQSLVLLQGILAKAVQGQAAEKLVFRLGQTLDSMSGMLNSLLDLNQIEAGAVRTQIADVAINDILLRLTDGFAYDALAKGLTLHVVPCTLVVRSDPRLLEQMMRNLLSNAIKYTSRGKVLLGCRRRADRLSVEVWDTGIGIPEDDTAAIFHEYHQLDSRAGRSSRGLGLGLSIVRRFGSLLGHEIRVHSVLGKGSMFSIELMCVARDSQTFGIHVGATIRDGAMRQTVSPGNILLIDDDLDTCEILGGLLRDEGFQVLTADDGVQALSMVAKDGLQPDLIVTDSKLPSARNGPEIIAALRARLNLVIPVITLTGDVSTDTVRTADLHNAVRLTKPVRLRELTNAIHRLLSLPHGVSLTSATRAQDEVKNLNGVTIFIVDDNDRVSEAIRDVVEADGAEVEAYTTSEAFLNAYCSGRTACLLIDAYLPGMNGLDMLRNLRQQGDAIPAIMITGNSDVSMAVQSMKAGAADFIEKPVSASELLASIKHALGHSRESERRLAWTRAAAGQIAGLTTRQREIMTLVMAGHPSKNIAADLGISQRTVENHRASIMRKTGARSLPALARLALAANWTEASGPMDPASTQTST